MLGVYYGQALYYGLHMSFNLHSDYKVDIVKETEVQGS